MTLLARRLVPDPSALAELLRTGQIRAPSREPRAPRLLSTGLASLDSALGGGLVRGALHEIVAQPSAGGTALLRAALAAATRAGELCALIDPADAFDPGPPDIELRRLLWVRPGCAADALRAAEIALEARFALVVLDLADAGNRPRARRPPGQIELVRFETQRAEKREAAVLAQASGWARLARRAEKHAAAVLVLSRAAQAGAFSSATVELERDGTRWEGSAGMPGRFFRGTSVTGAVARSRRAPPSAPMSFALQWEPR